MRHRKHGLLAGLLSVAALSVMAFASSAQANLPSPDFYLGGVPVNLVAGLGGEQLGVGTLSIPGLNAEVQCNKFTVASGTLNTPKDASGSLLFEECVTKEIGGTLATLTGCNIIVSSGDARKHITGSGLILPAELKDGSYAILIEKIVSLILYKSGEGCVMPTDNVIKGEICGKLLNNHAVKLEVEFSSEIQGLCRLRLTLESLEEGTTGVEDKLLYGAQPATIASKVDVFGTGTHVNKTLGVLLL